MKKLLLFFVLLCLFIAPVVAHADELVLTKIGALYVNGKYFNHWYYEPTKLTLEGTGSKGANIDVYVDGSVKTIKASVEDGSWKYIQEGELEKKDHTVKVASGGKEISFILTIGSSSVPEGAAQSNPSELPQTGALVPLAGLSLVAIFLVYYGFRKNNA